MEDGKLKKKSLISKKKKKKMLKELNIQNGSEK